MSHSNDGVWGICSRRCKPVNEVALKILNNGHVYITLVRYNPDDRVIMESQCIVMLRDPFKNIE